MDFLTFQSNCRSCKFGLKDGYLSEFELTCRRPDNIPRGHSWGICDEEHCPEFGVVINMKNITVYDADSLEVIGKAAEGMCRAVKKVRIDIYE